MKKILSFLGLLLLGSFVFAQTDAGAPVGWATQNGGTTGGSGTPVVAKTYAELKVAVTDKNVKVVHVSGVITIPSGGRITIQDQDGKSILGLPGSKIISTDMSASGSGIFYAKRMTNFVMRNLYFEGPGAYDNDGYDNFCIDNCQNVWVDHCEFHDGMDGNFDIKNMSDYVSVTWCTFSYEKPPKAGGSGGAPDHRYTNLIGSSASATGDISHLNTTFQYCMWGEGCRERMPRVRFGKIHLLNSLFSSSVSNYCARAGEQANILIEGCYFDNQKEPVDLYKSNAIVAENNNISTGGAISTQNKSSVFKPPYTYTIVAPANIVASINSCAGQTLNSSWVPDCGSVIKDCNGVENGTAYYDDCSVCVGGNTGKTACVADCNGDANGTAYLDNCDICVGGNTGETACTQDCNNEYGGTASIDDCGVCSGGSTALVPNASCQDCNGDKNGTATIDACGVCSGGNTGVVACAGSIQGEDACEGSWVVETIHPGAQGDAYANFDNDAGTYATWYIVANAAASESLGFTYANGSTAARPMELYINSVLVATLTFSPTANWDTWATEHTTVNLAEGVSTIKLVSTVAGVGGPNMDAISFTSDNLSAGGCSTDCNGIVGGSAFLDKCSTCVGGNTGKTACAKDCNGDWGGTAYVDNCSACVGGATGSVACSTDKTVELKAGWNLIGCPIEGSTEVDAALSSIWQYVESVKNQDGFMDKVSPAHLQSLSTLDWAQGYFVKVSQACTLNWGN